MLQVKGYQRTLIFVLLIVWALINLFPLAVMVVSGFKSTREIFLNPFGLPEAWSMASYQKAWNVAHFGTYFKNSVIVTLISIVTILIISSMGAYVLARFEFRGRRALFLYILAGLAMPVRLAIIPIFLIIRSLHLTNTFFALILVYTAGGISFSTFLLVNFFKNIPMDLEDAARIDGASYFRIYAQIHLPLLRPALATVTVFNFIRVWNDFFFPLIFIDSNSKKTIPLGIQNFFGEYSVAWDMLFSGLNIAVIPVIIFFIIMSKQFIGGLTEGAIK
ncbi:MAG: carbohydrate ABC transporter permease [Spirochaetales bacterium]|nr:carbohydrate ABC transporter permease [Spirochaetales bacterium]